MWRIHEKIWLSFNAFFSRLVPELADFLKLPRIYGFSSTDWYYLLVKTKHPRLMYFVEGLLNKRSVDSCK